MTEPVALPNETGSLKAVHVRHGQIQNDDVGVYRGRIEQERRNEVPHAALPDPDNSR